MTLKGILERIRDSQLFVPAVFMIASVVLVLFAGRLDRSQVSYGSVLVPASIDGARTLLATVAGAIITAAALVFSFSAVTVQLASSQYSPRVVQGFLRDRFQQTSIGIVMGTFTFALIGLASIGSDPADGARADWTATVGLVLGVVSAVTIVAYIDHVTRRVRIDDTMTRIAQATQAAFGRSQRESEMNKDSQPPAHASDQFDAGVRLRSDRAGFVQHIDVDRLLKACPDGATLRVEVTSGSHVIEGRTLVRSSVLGHDKSVVSELEKAVVSSITIGPTRSIEQDAGFGLRQLVDIALRALSPGINDPATAAEAVVHIVGCLRAARIAGSRRTVFVSDAASVILAAEPSFEELVRESLEPIRKAGHEHDLVGTSINDNVAALIDEMLERGIDASPLGAQVRF